MKIYRALLAICVLYTIALANVDGSAQTSALSINLGTQCSALQLSGVSDATACVQATIDAAFANNVHTVTCPSGASLLTSSTVYQDPPSNIRANGHYVTGAFNLAFMGSGSASDAGAGTNCAVLPNFNNGIAWIIGSGRGMQLRGVSIVGPSGGYRGQQNSAGVGLQVSDGASRTRIDDVYVGNFYVCEKFGNNYNGTLADSNTIFKGHVNNCFYGLWFGPGNDDINGVYDLDISSATYSVKGGQPVNVYGGNFSSSAQSNTFAITSPSALSGTYPNFQFSATITTPDSFLTGGNVYDSFAVLTANHGVIPFTLVSYNSSTQVATFQVYGEWLSSQYYNINILTATAISTDLQAVTNIYAAERVRVFSGGIFTVTGTWLEDTQAAVTLIEGQSIGSASQLAGLMINYDPAASGQTSNPNFYIQQSFPFIDGALAALDIHNISSQPGADRLIISGSGEQDGFLNYHDNGTALAGPNLTLQANQFVGSGLGGSAFGLGKWDQSPWTSIGGAVSGQGAYVNWQSINHSILWGYRPDVNQTPCLTPAQLSTLSGALPTIVTGSAISYPLPWGGATYRVCDWTGVPAHFFEISNHHFFSYGQNLTTSNVTGLSWSYTGGSDVVYMSTNLIARMFNGLQIGLNNGSGNAIYMVKGAYPTLGYVTVYSASNTAPNAGMAGTVGTIYTGTTVEQEAYSFTTTQ